MSKADQGLNHIQAEDINPKMAFGISTDYENCIQCMNSEKFVCVTGYYVLICKKHSSDNISFVPIPKQYGKLTAFTADDCNTDTMALVLAQKNYENGNIYLVFKVLQFRTSQLDDKNQHEEPLYWNQTGNLEIIALNINYKAGLVCALFGPPISKNSSTDSAGKAPGIVGENFVKIYSIEMKGNNLNPKQINEVKLNALYNYKNLLIGKYETDKVAVWGFGGYTILNCRNKDKPLVAQLGLNDKNRDTEKKLFGNCTFDIVACTWIEKQAIAFLNENCDIIVLDFSVGNGRFHRNLIKARDVFEGPSVGVALFEKDNNLFVANANGLISKLENKITKDEVIFEKPANSIKSVDNLPPMELKCLAAGARKGSEKIPFCVVMVTKDKQIFKLDMQNDNVISDGSNYKYYFCSYHSDEINCVDVAKLKSTIATASKDKTVRIWNYLNSQLEVTSHFKNEPKKLSFHPNGLHIAVMFEDIVNCYDVLEDRLVESKQIRYALSPRDVKFSNYGCMLAICTKGFVKIFNFYTDAILFDSNEAKNKYNMKGHTSSITSMCWDQDDAGIATCGNDGKVFYWDLNNLTQTIIYPSIETPIYSASDTEANFNFRDVQIMTDDDYVTKHLFALNDVGIMEIAIPPSNKESGGDNEKRPPEGKYLIRGKFSSIRFEQSSKLLFFACPDDMNQGLKILDLNSNKRRENLEGKEIPVPANAKGIRSFVPSPDLRSFFTAGNDSSLFIFETKTFTRNTDSKEAETKEDMIIVLKDDLDNNALTLRRELEEKDKEIADEEESHKKFIRKKDKEIKKAKNDYADKKDYFQRQREIISEKLKAQEIEFNMKLEEIQENHDKEMQKLKEERDKNLKIKEFDKNEEEKALAEEKTKQTKESNFQKQEQIRRENKMKELNKEEIDNLNDDIDIRTKELEEKREKIEKDKNTKMEKNDEDIGKMRDQLDQQKGIYEKKKLEHAEKSKKLKEEIDINKQNIRREEERKKSIQSELTTLKNANTQLAKQIQDTKADIRDKEKTINEKNELKKKLDKDNQELEKFKYVLHYKIKELKHTKEPKERKIQMMEKKAKDMEREIKTCESQQAKIIIELDAHHQVITILEEQIKMTEKRIAKLDAYNRLFQESLYNSMKRAKNHKDCKRELVLLKRNFLDKDNIENIDKPFETNYEQQRKFLEENVAQYKTKISHVINLFGSDYKKVMVEKKKLIEIVNQLKKEEKEIKENDFKSNQGGGAGKEKVKLKGDIPDVFKKKNLTKEEVEEEDEETILKDLSTELKEVEKKIQWYKYWQKRNREESKEKMEGINEEDGEDQGY
ncbi:MAG: hypothetical protein MJ252_12750 [archaeon]|nr:hypothetical protein [archaeon]